MSIEPCTTGKHSTTDLPPAVEKPKHDTATTPAVSESFPPPPPRAPVNVPMTATPPPPEPEVSDVDDPTLEVPDGRTCRRKACGQSYKAGDIRDGEKCVHHPGVPIFHEGSKGYSCCKRKVLEFDEFMKIEGCKTKDRHLFVGSGKKDKKGSEELLESVRHDFYQTGTSVIASFYLKKINKDTAIVAFPSSSLLQLDLVTADSPPKRFKQDIELFGAINTEKSSFKIMGTKLELNLVKADGASWQVLRADERRTGEIIQVGRAGRAS